MICNNVDLGAEWSNLKDSLINNTGFCLNCMGLAMHQTIVKSNIPENENNVNIKKLGIITARLINYEPVNKIGDVGVKFYGNIIIYFSI